MPPSTSSPQADTDVSAAELEAAIFPVKIHVGCVECMRLGALEHAICGTELKQKKRMPRTETLSCVECAEIDEDIERHKVAFFCPDAGHLLM